METKPAVESSPVQQFVGPHRIPLITHAKAGGEAAREVFEYLESIQQKA